MRNIVILLLFAAMAYSGHARQWSTDILGAPFQQTTVNLPGDYAGDPVCTVVRARSHGAQRAVLYIHGYNDYFFQKPMAMQFIRHGYSFYAVDLRRYGRSLRPADKPFDIRDISAYSAEIDSAISIIKDNGINEIVMLGHSTGGLIAATYLSRHHPSEVKALILNSPFLDWNLGSTEKFVPAIAAIGRLLPSLNIPQSRSTAYAESLLKSAHGEWTFDTDWKHPVSLPVTAGWIHAVDKAQRDLREIEYPVKVPVLLMMSERSISGDTWNPDFNKADAVLDVNDIALYGRRLSDNVRAIAFRGGLHDLALSSCPVRCQYYSSIFNWLDTIMPDASKK